MKLLAVLILLGAATTAHAQIVNVQGALAGDPEPGWTGQLTATADWRTGNTELLLIGGSATALYRHGPWLALGIARAEYAEGADEKISEKTFEHLRGRRDLNARWLWEAFAQHEYDAFRRLSVRALVGTGPAVRLVTRPRGKLLLGVAYLATYEQLDRRAGVIDAGDTRFEHRLSTYLTGVYAIDPRLAATQTIYVQPRLDEPSDLRVLSETSLNVKVSTRLAFANRLVIARDASPPDEIRELDTALKVDLVLTF